VGDSIIPKHFEILAILKKFRIPYLHGITELGRQSFEEQGKTIPKLGSAEESATNCTELKK
jgi:hypothetical protein